MSAKYLRLNGTATTADDPERGIWYSAVTTCGFWTDDWNTLNTQGSYSIPCCPVCGAPGMQTTAKEWFVGAARFEADGNERYRQFLAQSKNKCYRPMGLTMLENYRQWLEANPLRTG